MHIKHKSGGGGGELTRKARKRTARLPCLFLFVARHLRSHRFPSPCRETSPPSKAVVRVRSARESRIIRDRSLLPVHPEVLGRGACASVRRPELRAQTLNTEGEKKIKKETGPREYTYINFFLSVERINEKVI